MNIYSIACALNGVDGACFIRIGFPSTNGGIIDLNGIQKGKFQGTMSKKGPTGSCVKNDLCCLVFIY